MSNIFGGLSSDGLEESQDSLGGKLLFDTNAYDAEIVNAYTGLSTSGSRFIQLIFNINGKEFSSTEYITNKAGENWFMNKSDPTKKVPLPGFTLINDICLLATEKNLSDQDTEEKTVKVYDRDARKELNKQVPVLVELLGCALSLGIIRELVTVEEKDDDGNYQPTDKTRENNTIDKVFQIETGKTVVELREEERTGNVGEATFKPKWVEKHANKIRDKTKPAVVGASNGRPSQGAKGGAPSSSAPRKSIFGNKK